MTIGKGHVGQDGDEARHNASTHALLAIFVLLLIGYVINAVDRTSFPVFITDVREEYEYSLGTAGLISTVSYLGMGLAGFPAGYLLDRFSRKHIFNLGLLLFSVTTILTVVSFGFWDMLVYRVLSGAGESLQLTALLTIAGVLFSRHRGAAIGAVNTSFALGSFIGPYVGGVLLTVYSSWRVPMVVFGLVGVAAFIVTVIVVPKQLTDRRMASGQAMETSGGAGTLLNRNTMILVPATALGGLVTFGFLGMYPTFLQEELGYSASNAGLLLSIHGIGAVASLIGGVVGDRFDPRVVMVGAYTGTAVIGAIMFAGPSGFLAQAILSFALGVVYSGTVYVNLAGYVIKSVAQSLTGAASGVFITSIYVPAAFAGYTIGAMASAWDWAVAGLVQISAFSALGAVLCLFLVPGHFSRPITARESSTDVGLTGSHG